MAKTNDYGEIIQTIYNEIERLFKSSKLWEQEDEKITQLFALLKEAVWQQVHSVLVPQKTEKSEKKESSDKNKADKPSLTKLFNYLEKKFGF